MTRKRHPELPLSLYTYTAECQYGHLWTAVTMRCRGLIADDESGAVVALPFPKVFVTGMHGAHDFAPPLPDEPFEVFEKADGSLIILFHYAGRWHAASKGSFHSDQSQWAQKLLESRDLSGLDAGLTYLAEAIYPGNRIVVDYGRREELMLLGAYRPADGSEEPLSVVAEHWATIGTVARSWGRGSDISELARLATASTTIDGAVATGTEEEGYVVRFASGVRAKVKLASYLAIHRLFTGTNERTVWDVVSSGRSPAVLFDTAPDEFADWTRQVADRLRAEHDAMIAEATAHYTRTLASLPANPDRKTFAGAAAESPYRAVLFLLLDHRTAAVDAWAWRQVRPRADRPFTTDEDN